MSSPEAPPAPAWPSWAITAEDVYAYVGKARHSPGHGREFEADVAEEANTLVSGYIGTHAVPQAVAHRAALEVASELHHRRNAPNGIAQFATPDGSPVRVARDPMLGAYPLLNRYLPGGFA